MVREHKAPMPAPCGVGALSQHIKVFASSKLHGPWVSKVFIEASSMGIIDWNIGHIIFNPLFTPWSSKAKSPNAEAISGPNRSHLITKILSLRKFPGLLKLLLWTQDQDQTKSFFYYIYQVNKKTKQTLNGQLTLMAKGEIDKIHLVGNKRVELS